MGGLEDMIETFKILNKCYDEKCIDTFFQYKDTNTRGHTFAVKIEAFNTNVTKNYFTNRVASLWNSLPSSVVESKSVNHFKVRLDKHCKSIKIIFDPALDFQDCYGMSNVLKSI